MNASVTSDDLAEYDIISEGPRSLESSLADLTTEIAEPTPLQAAKDKFETVGLDSEDIQAYVRKALEGKPGAADIKERKLMRVYVDGTFDGLHAGHGLQLRQAKLSFPSTYLIVGVFSDALCQNSTPAVRPHVERCEVVRHCRWVDEVVPGAPWILDAEYLRAQRIDYVAVDEGATVDPAFDKARLRGYDALKSIGKVIPTRRTLGLAPPPQFSPATPRVSTLSVPRHIEAIPRKAEEREDREVHDGPAPSPADPITPWTRPHSPAHEPQEPLIAFEN